MIPPLLPRRSRKALRENDDDWNRILASNYHTCLPCCMADEAAAPAQERYHTIPFLYPSLSFFSEIVQIFPFFLLSGSNDALPSVSLGIFIGVLNLRGFTEIIGCEEEQAVIKLSALAQTLYEVDAWILEMAGLSGI